MANAPSKKSEIELQPEAWSRFKRAVEVVASILPVLDRSGAHRHKQCTYGLVAEVILDVAIVRQGPDPKHALVAAFLDR